jgi:hypothetical protein
MTPRRDDPSKGGYAVRVPDRTSRPQASAEAGRAEPPPREPSQAELDSHMRSQGRDQREAEAMMREFRDSTRMRYMQGGEVNTPRAVR